MHPPLDEIVSEFTSATERLRRLGASVTGDLWRRRPGPGSWSPSECVAHLNLTAVAMLPLLERGVEDARRDARRPGASYRRDLIGWLLWRAISQPGKFKSKTTAAFVPSGDRPAAELIPEFERLQAAHIALLKQADGLPIDRVKIASPFNQKVRYSVFSAFAIQPRHQHRHLWQAEAAARS
jgi:hypothetical protein